MKTSIITTVTEAATGKKRKRSFTDINPNASNEQLKNFAVTFVGLTTNAYVETERVDKISVDSEGDRKDFRDLKITGASQGSTATISFNIIEDESVAPAIFYYTNNTVTVLRATQIESPDTYTAMFTVTIPNTAGQIYIGILEQNNFYSTFVDMSIV